MVEESSGGDTPLKRAVDRLVATARDAHARGESGSFVYSSGAQAFYTVDIMGGTFGEWRLFAVDRERPDLQREVCAFAVGGVRFIYGFYKGGEFVGRGTLSPDYVSVHCAFEGDRSYRVGSTVVATAKAGDYVFATNKSPVVETSMPQGYAGISVMIPIPAGQRFTLPGSSTGDGRSRSSLDDGFFVLGPSSLWDTHIAYALDQAVEQVLSGVPAPGFLLSEYLYLLFRHELASYMDRREADPPFAAAPLRLRVAEAFVIENAAQAPSVEQVAETAGTSVRNLHSLFVRFRGASPREFIREQRLLGIRGAFNAARRGATVADVAASWGYQNFGNFAASYKKRFGELPSETLARAVATGGAQPA